MFLEEIPVGKSIEMYVQRDIYRYRFVTKVESNNKKGIYVSLITGQNKVFQTRSDDKVSIVCKGNDRMWTWSNVQCTIELLDQERMHYLVPANLEGKSYNRREAFRVFVGEETKAFHVMLDQEKVKKYREEHPEVSDEDMKKSDEVYFLDEMTVLLKDISETGIGLYINRILDKGDVIRGTYQSEFGEITYQGKIVRILDGKVAQTSYHHFYGVEFTEKTKNLNKILAEMQRKQLYLAKLQEQQEE